MVSASNRREQKLCLSVLNSSQVFVSIAVISVIGVANHRVGIVLIVLNDANLRDFQNTTPRVYELFTRSVKQAVFSKVLEFEYVTKIFSS